MKGNVLNSIAIDMRTTVFVCVRVIRRYFVALWLYHCVYSDLSEKTSKSTCSNWRLLTLMCSFLTFSIVRRLLYDICEKNEAQDSEARHKVQVAGARWRLQSPRCDVSKHGPNQVPRWIWTGSIWHVVSHGTDTCSPHPLQDSPRAKGG